MSKDTSRSNTEYEDYGDYLDNTIEINKRHKNKPYGQAYPPGASAEERSGPSASTVQVHHDKLRKLHQLYGQKLPDIKEPPAVTLQNTMVELLRSLKRVERLEMAKIPLGRTYTYNLTLQSTQRILHIDFTDGALIKNLPAGMIINCPGRKLFSISITNDGSGEVSFSINLKDSEHEAVVNLKNGETKEFSFPVALVETLNIMATSGNANVRIITMV